ncbi:cytochrome P450 [Actinomadura sp. DC4]|uniref:cytochrome P450 family protein n=1 Tax=Actinomadura sp. DC4 TaxID=3055069 RepID=UPI0025B2388D|nr:cytochrome P450 [Actinomadura sp. DC4]MDN3358995.1 cytochrome P450 [Actinomadura sp. DC4]
MTAAKIPVPAEHIYDTQVRLRRTGPVVPVELPGGVEVWAANTHAAVHEVLADDKVYARNARHWPALRDGTIPADWPFLPFVEGDNMLMQDGADHRRMRAMVNRAFTPARVAALAPRIGEIAGELADDVAAAGDGVDLVSAFGGVLPLQVICELFGIPEPDRAQFRVWTQQVMSAGGEGIAARQAMVGYLARFVDRRRGDPKDDLTSTLIAVQKDGEVTLSDEELADLLWLILLAGNETTTHLLNNAVVALSRHEDQRDLAVREGRWAEVVEETLRRYPSVATVLMRYTTRDTTLAGVDLPAGAPILLSVSATLTDTAQHGAGADRFDITRTQRPNLAFGHGPHFCLGAPLGRLEGRIGLATLYGRFPKMRMAIDPADLVYTSFSTSGPTSLPVLLG